MNETHFHKRNLPHFYRPNTTFFITYRLKGTIPIKILKQLKEKYNNEKIPLTKDEKYKNEKLYFAEYDRLLDFNNEIQHLKNKEIAKEVKYSLHYSDKKDYGLICYTIMPNHVHLVLHLLEKARGVDKIMQSIKKYYARDSDQILNRKGSFWQSESFDHIVRDEDELNRIINYVIMNPVKAGLVEKWEDWEHTYLAEVWW